MDSQIPLDPSCQESASLKRRLAMKVFGVGGAGCNAVAQMMSLGLENVALAAVNTDAEALARSPIAEKVRIGGRRTRGLGAGGDPECGREAAEADLPALRAQCRDTDIVFIIAGLGGGTGTGACPVVARAARESGALVLCIVTLPYHFESGRRQRQAREGLETLRAAADAVICLPNQMLFKLVDEHTPVLEAFRFSNDLLARGVSGIWRMLSNDGLIAIDFAHLCSAVRDRHADSILATAEALGPNRARDLVEGLMTNPVLEHGKRITEAESLLVSIVGGPDLSMAEIDRVTEQLNRLVETGNVVLGVAVEPAHQGRLSMTVIASRRAQPLTPVPASRPDTESPFVSQAEAPTRSSSRCGVPPPPELSAEQTRELFKQQSKGPGTSAKKGLKWFQPTLPLEVISKGRFEKSEPTLHKGEDLDVPTYLRRGVALN